jgi:hypothetical protein
MAGIEHTPGTAPLTQSREETTRISVLKNNECAVSRGMSQENEATKED